MEEKQEKQQVGTQTYLPIKEIRENILIMNDNSLRAVVLVSSVNFSLKNVEERNAIIMGYQNFLNSLEFPIQILATSRKVNLDNYLAKLEQLKNSQSNPLLRLQTEEYQLFIKRLLEVSNIMEKRFFVVVPYYLETVTASKGIVSSLAGKKQGNQISKEDFDNHKLHLSQRVENVIQGLTSANLRCARLGTESLIELFYTMYNPETAQEQKIEDLENFEAPFIESEKGKDQEGEEIVS